MANKKVYTKKKAKMSMKQIYAYIITGTVMAALASYYFVLTMELYTPGLAGIINGFIFTLQDIFKNNGMEGFVVSQQFKATSYWIMYIILNIPIIYLTLRWYSNKFFVLSVSQFFIQFAFTMFLTYTPGFRDVLDLHAIEGAGGYVVFLFLALLAGVMYGVGNGLIFRVGACTMGLDPIMRYFSRERDKNIGPLLFGVTIVNTTLWTMIRYFTNPPALDGGNFENFIHGTILSKQYIASWVYVAVYSFTAGAIYASNKKAEIRVKSLKIPEMSKYFNEHRFHRGHTLLFVEGGYTGQKRVDLQMIINYEEMHDVVEMMAAIDPNALITVNEIKKVYDVKNWNPVTDDDKKKAMDRAKKEEARRKRLADAKEARENKKAAK